MPKTPTLTASELNLVESLARFYEAQGAPRIGGRLLGLLMMVDGPLSLEDMARTLKASLASISTNVRALLVAGMVEHETFPGDRRDYYRFSDKAWEHRIRSSALSLRSFRDVAEESLGRIPKGNKVARERLAQMREFCILFEDLGAEALQRWQRKYGKPVARKR